MAVFRSWDALVRPRSVPLNTPTPVLVNRARWMEQAVCAGVGADPWFLNRGNLTQPDHVAALQACTRCPVRTHCAAYAEELVAHGEHLSGIWGGRYYTGREHRGSKKSTTPKEIAS